MLEDQATPNVTGWAGYFKFVTQGPYYKYASSVRTRILNNFFNARTVLHYFHLIIITGFRPVLEAGNAPRNTPPLFFPPHLASHLSSQFSPPLFPALKAFPGLCSCCPIKPISSLPSLLPLGTDAASSSSSTTTTASASIGGGDQRSSSVAELRRKAQEHSAALLQSLHHVASFQQAALNFPLLPPLTLQALQRKHDPVETATSKGEIFRPFYTAEQSYDLLSLGQKLMLKQLTNNQLPESQFRSNLNNENENSI